MQTPMPRFVRILVGVVCATILGSIGLLTSTQKENDRSGLIPEDVTLTTVSQTSVAKEMAERLDPSVEPRKEKRRFKMPVRRRAGSPTTTEPTELAEPNETLTEVNDEEFDAQPNLPAATANQETLPIQVEVPLDTSADSLPANAVDEAVLEVSADIERVDTSPLPEVNTEKKAVAATQTYTRAEQTNSLEIRQQVEVTRAEPERSEPADVSETVDPKVTLEPKSASQNSVPNQVTETSQPRPQPTDTLSDDKVEEFQLRIENPKELGVSLKFTYRRKVRSLQPGETFQAELGASGKAIVQFDRGRNGIRAIRTLTAGHYAFRATKRGWKLDRVEEARK